MQIKVLLSGCKECKRTYTLLYEAAQKLGNNSLEIIPVEEILEILKYNIITPPAIIANEKVIHKGHIKNEEEATLLITQLLAQ